MEQHLWDIYLSFIDKIRQKRIIEKIRCIDEKEWLRINHDLNSFEWPQQLLKLRPRWWNGSQLPRKTYSFITPIMDVINKKFTEKEQLRYHNVVVGKMTEKQFEYWFNCARGDNAGKSGYYDKVMYMEEIEWWQEDIFNAIKELTVS